MEKRTVRCFFFYFCTALQVKLLSVGDLSGSDNRSILVNREPGNNKSQVPGGAPQGRGCWIGMIWLVLLLLVAPLLFGSFLGGGGGNGDSISYTTFREQIQAGNVSSVVMRGERISGELIQPLERVDEAGQTLQYSNFVTYLPSTGDEELFQLLLQQNVEIETRPQEEFAWGALLISVLPFLLLVGLAFFFLRSMRGAGGAGGVMQMGKSRAQLYDKQKQGITFSDVAGAEGTKRELTEVVEYLKDPRKFSKLGGTIPKGVLLVGPPGTGKTLLARAAAGEADAPFFSITGSDFMEMFVGVGASRVRNLFEDAKKNAPSIIFIDELDSIGRRRGAGMGGGHDEREQTLNQLLSEMDGFTPNQNVIVMAATNRPDILDPALLRPGRFDRQVTVDLPTMHERLQILNIHTRNKPLADDVILEKLARGTPGFSGADLANILNEAALLAARQNKEQIDMDDINNARDKVIMGLERENLSLTEKEYQLLAYHEAGHAVVSACRPTADPIHKVTIVPRGRAMGVTQSLPERDRYLYNKDYMMDRLAVMMGGRAAEQLVLKTATSGAENDLKQATQLARKMVVDWGMSERVGLMSLGSESEQVFLGEDMMQTKHYSETTAREIDEAVREFLNEAYALAHQTLIENREGMERLVELLLEKEVVDGHEVMETLGLTRQPAD
jgi:cell division protease FtsH